MQAVATSEVSALLLLTRFTCQDQVIINYFQITKYTKRQQRRSWNKGGAKAAYKATLIQEASGKLSGEIGDIKDFVYLTIL